jgi:hypothetical protein
MKIMTFDYVKANGTKSHRDVIMLRAPTDLYFGVDVSELPEEERITIAVELARVKGIYDKAISAVMHDHDVVHNFRQFNPESMTNIESEIFYG